VTHLWEKVRNKATKLRRYREFIYRELDKLELQGEAPTRDELEREGDPDHARAASAPFVSRWLMDRARAIKDRKKRVTALVRLASDKFLRPYVIEELVPRERGNRTGKSRRMPSQREMNKLRRAFPDASPDDLKFFSEQGTLQKRETLRRLHEMVADVRRIHEIHHVKHDGDLPKPEQIAVERSFPMLGDSPDDRERTHAKWIKDLANYNSNVTRKRRPKSGN